jgi:hypothetical protein
MIKNGKPNVAEYALMYMMPISMYFMFKCIQAKDIFGIIYMFILVFIGLILMFEWSHWKWYLVSKIRKGTEAIIIPESQEIPIMDCVDTEIKFRRSK